MARFAIDAPTALRMVDEGVTVHPDHQLVAPNLLRSEALSIIYRAVRDGSLDRARSRAVLDGITTMRIRLLGDRVSRSTAFRIADEHGWSDTRDAEYLAVAKLQADALVTVDAPLAALARGIVPLEPFEVLARP
jgi:predicted nucleic acid-binding protein